MKVFCGKFSLCGFSFFVLPCDLCSEADVRGFSRRLLCVLCVNMHPVTSVCIEVSSDFWKMNMKHLQNGLNLQSWGLQVVIWLFRTFHVVFLNWDPQTYEPLKDFGLKVHGNFSFWPDVFSFWKSSEKASVAGRLSCLSWRMGQKQSVPSTVNAQKSVAMLSKGREFRKGLAQILLWQQEFFFLSRPCCSEILLFPGMLWNTILMFWMLAVVAASFLH